MGSTFSWLHLTDFHYGLNGQSTFWSNLRQPFLDDIAQLHERTGPWQAIIFTGDIVQKGDPDEFREVQVEVLDRLWKRITDLGSGDAVLLAVPGNHDLYRLMDDDNAALDRLIEPHSFANIADRFWNNAKGSYRQVIDKAFAAYSEWWKTTPRRPSSIVNGLLPGDFATSLEVDGRRIGIVGLNTTFLQLRGGDYRGKLVWDARQLQAVCQGAIDDWLNDHDASLLLTHQGPDWLTPECRKHGQTEICPAGRFVAHLFGHMHETQMTYVSIGGSRLVTRLCQSRSLFGMEHFGDPPTTVRSHGYCAGRIAFGAADASLRIWPRRATNKLGPWRFVADEDEAELEADGGTPQEALRLRANSLSSPGSRCHMHRAALLKRATDRDWWARAIPIMVRQRTGGPARDGRDALRTWLNTAERHCAILGEAGSGKTGLLWWTASVASQLDDTVTLFVPAAKLRTIANASLLELAALSDPPFRIESNGPELKNRKLLLLLDGLDELIGVNVQGEHAAAELLSKALHAVPESTRVVLTCRALVFPLLEGALQQILPNNNQLAHDDPWDSAIQRALGRNGPFQVFHVQSLAAPEAERFLVSGDLSAHMVQLATESAYIKPFLSSPFSVRLLTKALPVLVDAGPITVVDLYETFVRTVLVREKNSAGDVEAVVDELCGAATTSPERIAPRTRTLLLRIGILTERLGRLEFSHYSFWEYFFSLALVKEMSAFDSGRLARLDLVNAYNVNRMLVPMLLRLTNSRAGRASSRRVVAVAADEYRKFLRSTGWRKASNYGIHPSATRAANGTPSATFVIDYAEAQSIHGDRRHGDGVAAGVSWYDAAVYAMSIGATLPTSEDLRALSIDGDYLVWCADWHTEEVAHILALETKSGKLVGINPDVRLPRTAVAVCRPVQAA